MNVKEIHGVSNDAQQTIQDPNTLKVDDLLVQSDEVGNPMDTNGFDLAAATAATATPAIKLVEHITSIPVGRPSPQLFIRVNPDPAFRAQVKMLHLKDFGEYWVIYPAAAPAFDPEDLGDYLLYSGVDVDGNPFVWPLRLDDGRGNSWHTSALEAAEEAKCRWVRVKSRMPLKAYSVIVAEGTLPEPIFPPLSFSEILTMAFKGRIVRTELEPIVGRMRGR